MIEYMDYVVKAFQQSTSNLSSDACHNYESLTSNSSSILNFQVPNSLTIQLSNKSSPYTFNTIDFSTNKVINGSFTYLYTDAEQLQKLVKNSADVNLQDVGETYKYHYSRVGKVQSVVPWQPRSLYYGRIYFPNSSLEAMAIKKFSPYSQLVVKCLSSLNSHNIITAYLQTRSFTGNGLQEFIYSSNDMLCGYRFLHKFIESPSKFNNSLYNNSSLSVGGEAWLTVSTLSPSISTSVRYCTHSTNTGLPLTLTLSLNPLFGHISSTYSAKTGSNSTFCAKYDFNFYSIESNLSLGCEFWNQGLQPKAVVKGKPEPKTILEKHITSPESYEEAQALRFVNSRFSSSLTKINNERMLVENTHKVMHDTNFTSVWKLSTSIRDQNLRLLWSGKYKGFLLSAGTELLRAEQTNDEAQSNGQAVFNFYPAKIGLQIQFST